MARLKYRLIIFATKIFQTLVKNRPSKSQYIKANKTVFMKKTWKKVLSKHCDLEQQDNAVFHSNHGYFFQLALLND